MTVRDSSSRPSGRSWNAMRPINILTRNIFQMGGTMCSMSFDFTDHNVGSKRVQVTVKPAHGVPKQKEAFLASLVSDWLISVIDPQLMNIEIQLSVLKDEGSLLACLFNCCVNVLHCHGFIKDLAVLVSIGGCKNGDLILDTDKVEENGGLRSCYALVNKDRLISCWSLTGYQLGRMEEIESISSKAAVKIIEFIENSRL
jgi:ribonuclease PH